MGNQIHAGTMIYGINREQAESHMNELVEQSGETIIRKYKDQILTDKNKYRAKTLSNNCRGYRYLTMYISKDILLNEDYVELLSDVALPKLVPPSYYDLDRFGEEYDWREHVYIY